MWRNPHFYHSKNSQIILINLLGHIFLRYDKIFPCHVQKYSSNIPFLILPYLSSCEASTLFICLIALKICGHSFLFISLPHAKIQLNLASKYFLANFQSFWSIGSFVKQVLARSVQMSCNFSIISICSNYSAPPNLRITPSTMWP